MSVIAAELFFIGPIALAAASILTSGIIWYLISVRPERILFRDGVTISAVVRDVRIDEGDCIVEYAFVDPKSGRTFSRSGVAGFLMADPPKPGDSVDVTYLPGNPRLSRLVGEIHLSSR